MFKPQYANTKRIEHCHNKFVKSLSFSSVLDFQYFRHIFRHYELNSSDLQELIDNYQHVLLIMVVREPCEWPENMYQKP